MQDPIESAGNYGLFYTQEDIQNHRTDNPSPELRIRQFDRISDGIQNFGMDVADFARTHIAQVSFNGDLSDVLRGYQSILTYIGTETKVATNEQGSEATLYASYHSHFKDDIIMHGEHGTRFLFEADTPLARFTQEDNVVVIDNLNPEIMDHSGPIFAALTEIFILSSKAPTEEMTDR